VFKADPGLYDRYRAASYAERRSPAVTQRPAVDAETTYGGLVLKAARAFAPEAPLTLGLQRVRTWMPDLWAKYRAEYA